MGQFTNKLCWKVKPKERYNLVLKQQHCVSATTSCKKTWDIAIYLTENGVSLTVRTSCPSLGLSGSHPKSCSTLAMTRKHWSRGKNPILYKKLSQKRTECIIIWEQIILTIALVLEASAFEQTQPQDQLPLQQWLINIHKPPHKDSRHPSHRRGRQEKRKEKSNVLHVQQAGWHNYYLANFTDMKEHAYIGMRSNNSMQ